MARAAAIYSTELDLTRLENAANCAGSNLPLTSLANDLIIHANVVPGNKILADVVTTNSVVYMVDDTGAEQEWMFIYLEEANMVSARLLVLSPMGAALLGARAGKSVKYSAPNGAQRPLRIDHAAFQPEVAGQYTL